MVRVCSRGGAEGAGCGRRAAWRCRSSHHEPSNAHVIGTGRFANGAEPLERLLNGAPNVLLAERLGRRTKDGDLLNTGLQCSLKALATRIYHVSGDAAVLGARRTFMLGVRAGYDTRGCLVMPVATSKLSPICASWSNGRIARCWAPGRAMAARTGGTCLRDPLGGHE